MLRSPGKSPISSPTAIPTILDTTKNNGGVGKQTSRNQGKHENFRARTPVLEDLVFHPSSSATKFKKFNDRLVDYVAVSFKHFGQPMSKAPLKLAKLIFVLPEHPDLDPKSYATKVVVCHDAFTRVKYDSHCFTKAN